MQAIILEDTFDGETFNAGSIVVIMGVERPANANAEEQHFLPSRTLYHQRLAVVL